MAWLKLNGQRTVNKAVLLRRRRYFRAIKPQIKNELVASGKYHCPVCNCEHGLELHHRTPLVYGGDVWDVVPLCHEHHLETHAQEEF